MFSRRVKRESSVADKAGTTLVREPAGPQVAYALGTKAEVTAARKPSERFMRKPLHASSRASRSERRRLADLASRLRETTDSEATLNETLKINSYRPASERPPG